MICLFNQFYIKSRKSSKCSFFNERFSFDFFCNNFIVLLKILASSRVSHNFQTVHTYASGAYRPCSCLPVWHGNGNCWSVRSRKAQIFEHFPIWTSIVEAQVQREKLLLRRTESLEQSSVWYPGTYWYMYFQKATENSSVYTGIHYLS